jgi:hypothetical protein
MPYRHYPSSSRYYIPSTYSRPLPSIIEEQDPEERDDDSIASNESTVSQNTVKPAGVAHLGEWRIGFIRNQRTVRDVIASIVHVLNSRIFVDEISHQRPDGSEEPTITAFISLKEQLENRRSRIQRASRSTDADLDVPLVPPAGSNQLVIFPPRTDSSEVIPYAAKSELTSITAQRLHTPDEEGLEVDED